MSTPKARPSKITDAELLAAVPRAQNMRQLLLMLGVAAYGGNYEVIRQRLRLLGVEAAALQPRTRTWQPVPTEVLAAAIARSDSYASVAHRVGWGDGAAALRRVQSQATAAGLDTSHFLGQGWRRGSSGSGRSARPLEEVLVRGRRPGSTTDLRRRLVDEGVLAAECAACARDEWQGRRIPLELDHVNGDRTDNRLENLRLLCPNCHAQTDTYRGRNIGAPRAPAPAEPVTPVPDRAATALRRLLLVMAPRTS